MVPVKLGQQFYSQSKVQDFPVLYLFNGIYPGEAPYDIALKDVKTGEEIFVEPEWFNQRKITEIN